MEVRHDDPELEQIEIRADFDGRYGVIVAKGFRKAMNLVRQAKNEVELHNWKGLRLEKLAGKRDHQHSMRINDQWRLIVEFVERPGPSNNVCAVKAIEDYH
jgi:proteic killer suppression protein